MSDYFPNQPLSSDRAHYNMNLPELSHRDHPYLYQQPQRVNIWLRLTSAVARLPQQSLDQREGLRRNRLTSWILLGMFVLVCLLIPAGIGSPSTAVAIGIAGVGLVLASVFNHAGWTTAAAVFLVVLIDAGIIGALAGGTGGLEVVDLPAYDLLAISVVVGATILPRAAAFVIAFCNCALITVSFLLLPKAPDLLQQIAALGAVSLLARPIALQALLAIIAYLWVRGVDQQVRRADRAEEMAALEHAYAEQRRQLEIGVQQILATHVRIANGDYTARAPLSQENVLWQIAASLNNLLVRLQRAGQADYQLQRTEEEIDRLAVALRDLQAGRRAIWPAPAGTSADKLLAVLAPPQLRQPGPAGQPGERSFREGPSPRGGQQQWQMEPGSGGRGQSGGQGQSGGLGGMSPQPGREQSRVWSEPPDRFGAGYSNPLPQGGGRFGQGAFGQQPPSMPPAPQQPQDPASTGPNDQFWPSLDPFSADDRGGRVTNDPTQQGGSFPSLDNPWYLPPDE